VEEAAEGGRRRVGEGEPESPVGRSLDSDTAAIPRADRIGGGKMRKLL